MQTLRDNLDSAYIADLRLDTWNLDFQKLVTGFYTLGKALILLDQIDEELLSDSTIQRLLTDIKLDLKDRLIHEPTKMTINVYSSETFRLLEGLAMKYEVRLVDTANA